MEKRSKSRQLEQVVEPMAPIIEETKLYYGLFAAGRRLMVADPNAYPNSPGIFNVTRLHKSNLVSRPPIVPVDDQAIDAITSRIATSHVRDKAARQVHFDAIDQSIQQLHTETTVVDHGECNRFVQTLSALDQQVDGGLDYLIPLAFRMSRFALSLQHSAGDISSPTRQHVLDSVSQMLGGFDLDQTTVSAFSDFAYRFGIDGSNEFDLVNQWSNFGPTHIKLLRPILDQIVATLERHSIDQLTISQARTANFLDRYFSVETVIGQSISDFMEGAIGLSRDGKTLLSLRMPGNNFVKSDFKGYVPLALWLQKKDRRGQKTNFTPIIKLVRQTPKKRLVAAYAGQRNTVGTSNPRRDSDWHSRFNFKANPRTGYAETTLYPQHVRVVGVPLGLCELTPEVWKRSNQWTSIYGSPPVGLKEAYRSIAHQPAFQNATMLRFAQSAD